MTNSDLMKPIDQYTFRFVIGCSWPESNDYEPTNFYWFTIPNNYSDFSIEGTKRFKTESEAKEDCIKFINANHIKKFRIT